jgi:hypothetical protein
MPKTNFVYHGSLGKYATLEKVMGKHKQVHLKKDKSGYIDIYIPKSEDYYECSRKGCSFKTKSREKMFAHIRKTGHSTHEIPKRASKFLK